MVDIASSGDEAQPAGSSQEGPVGPGSNGEVGSGKFTGQQCQDEQARHHQKFQQLRRESAENLRFRRENEDLLNQLQTAKELYESEKNSSKQLSNLASSRQSEIDIIKTASEELETKLSDVGSQVLQVSQGCVCTGGAKRRGSEVSRKEAFVC